MTRTVLFLWLMGVGMVDAAALNTSWIGWTLLFTAAVWLWLTHNLRVRVAQEAGALESSVKQTGEQEIDCVRFPDQCPCTTEWGKGIR